ncbi:MAG: c-type cytochrome [Pseudomonadota bacterium]
MRTAQFLSILVILACIGMPTFAEGDPEAGKTKAVVCAACHGADGNSVNPEWPNLAGQHETYAITQLKAFNEGTRNNPLMNAQAAILSDQDMKDLAAFYSAQSPSMGSADPALARAGEQLYRGGNKDTGVPACASCHGPSGRGNPTAGFPIISGQHARYTEMQLAAYSSGERRSDMNQMMRNVAAAMSDAEIKAVAAYLQGLRSTQ